MTGRIERKTEYIIGYQEPIAGHYRQEKITQGSSTEELVQVDVKQFVKDVIRAGGTVEAVTRVDTEVATQDLTTPYVAAAQKALEA